MRLVDPEAGEETTDIGDTLLGLKWRAVSESARSPAVLAGFTMRLPTGAEGNGADGVDPGALVAVSRVLGDFQLTGNGGYTWATDDRALDFWTAASSVEWVPVLGSVIAAEVFATIGADRAPETVLFRLGAVRALSIRVKIDAAAAAGVTESSPDLVLTTGLTWLLF